MTRLTELALRWPAITFWALAGVLVGGLWAAWSLKQELTPDVAFPQATVLTGWPGASADQVTRDVVQPIEAALAGVDEVPVVEVSATASDSFAAVMVRTEHGTEPAALRDAIRARLDTLDLPEGAGEPEIALFSFSDLPVVQASIRASGQNIDPVALQGLIEDVIMPEIETVEGVSQVTHVGGADEKIYLNLDAAKMAEAGVTLDTIRAMLAANNISLPVGEIQADGRAIPLLVSHRVQSEADLAALVLGPRGGATGASDRAGDAQPGGPPGANDRAASSQRGSPPGAGDHRTSGTGSPTVADRAAIRPTSAATTLARDAASLPSLEPTGSAAKPGTATPEGPPARLQVVVVVEGDTLIGLARRYGVAPEVIRQANGLGPDEALLAGSVLRVPVATGDDRLPPLWQVYGVTRASEVAPELLDRVLAETPAAVSNLSAAQLLALPPATVRRLPLPLISRQPDALRLALVQRMGIFPTSTPRPTPAPTLGPARDDAAPVVRLGDVATITREVEGGRIIHRSDGEASQGLLVFKEQSANTVTTVNEVLQRMEALRGDERLDGIEWHIVFEQASFIEESLAGVQSEGLLGSLLAVLIILVFLHFSVRATLVIAISIPLSILSALLLMQLRGLTLNMLTLAGLTIAIGRVVDDAVVVIENIYRHIQRGEEDTGTAVIRGTREVATAITAATLVTVAVFLPLGYVGGVTSEIFLPFAQTTTFALLASLIVAVTIVPLLASRLLRREQMPEPGETWLQRVYAPVLGWALGHRLVTMLLATALFIASLALLRVVDRSFLPRLGEPSVRVELALPPGTALATTDAIARRVEQRLLADADLEAVETTIGRGAEAFGRFTGGDSARAYFFAGLANGADADAVAERLREELGALANEVANEVGDEPSGDEAIHANLVAAGTPITFAVNSGAAVGLQGNLYDLQILSDDEAALREANARVMAALGDGESWRARGYDKVPIINLRSNLTEARQVVGVDVDPAVAIQQGLTAAQVALALRGAIEGQALGRVELVGPSGPETLAVVARYPRDALGSVAALADFEVEGREGAVPLGEIAAIRERPGPAQIARIDGRRAALISGLVTTGDTFGVADDAAAIIAELNLDAALGAGVAEVGPGLETRLQRQGFGDMLAALPISIIVVYLIMVVTFGSLVHPLTILFSLPFALSGALAGLALTGRPLSMSSLIGLMMLVGIVTTNAIVLVDLVQQHRARGLAAREALMRGGRTRVRPIIMTALATVIALIPLAIGLTEGALIASELATTVIGGLVSSTLLTLIIVPVIYSLLDDLRARVTERGQEPSPGDVSLAPGGASSEPAILVETEVEPDAGVTAAAAAAASDVAARSALLTDTGAIQAIPATAETPGAEPTASDRPLDTGEVPVMPG